MKDITHLLIKEQEGDITIIVPYIMWPISPVEPPFKAPDKVAVFLEYSQTNPPKSQRVNMRFDKLRSKNQTVVNYPRLEVLEIDPTLWTYRTYADRSITGELAIASIGEFGCMWAII